MKSTIKDIAKKLEISPSTVSRGLHDHPDISKSTKNKIKEVAKELNYHTNFIAQNLQKGTSDIIGVVVPQVKHKFFAEIMAGITDVAEEAGYNVMVCQSNNDYQNEARNVKTLVQHQIAGLLISVSGDKEKSEHLELVLDQDIPLVFFDRAFEGISASRVIVDDYSGAYKAVNALIEMGYKRIAHIAGDQDLLISRKRYQGYKDALEDNGLTYDDKAVEFVGMNKEDGRTGFKKIMENVDKSPDVLFAVNDPVAIGAYLEMRNRGIDIPEDIALLGFCNNPNSRLVNPSLSTVDQPAYKIGKEATNLLVDKIKGNTKEVTEKVLDTNLIIREST